LGYLIVSVYTNIEVIRYYVAAEHLELFSILQISRGSTPYYLCEPITGIALSRNITGIVLSLKFYIAPSDGPIMRLYIDSNVVISQMLGEFGKKYEFMEDAVKQFATVCAEDGHVLLLSDLLFEEVEKRTGASRDDALFILPDVSFEEVETLYKDLECAGKISNTAGITGPDAVHICLAMRAKADYIITWNIKHFRRPGVPIQSLNPREFVL